MGKKRPPLSQVHKNMNFDISEDNALVTKEEKIYSEGSFVDLPISKVELDKNIRDIYADDSLDELGDSILENGQIQPIVVYPKDGKYIVKVGHRRYKACLLRDIPTIKCIIQKDFEDEKQRIITQAIENEQRLNLSSRERESYIARLIELGLSQVEIARVLHKTKGWVSEALTSYKLVSENEELFKELSEEPSTRDTWKASTLTKEQLKSAISEAKIHGGTKDAFKKEVSKRFEENAARKKRPASSETILKCSLIVDNEKKSVIFDSRGLEEPDLKKDMSNVIKRYYSKRGYEVIL
ncbi:MAG: ParB/RepB/Spo0J family partition protein [Treponema sp.]|nr:ParB/RepB/Spo0J family partition protein [Treponema sp.]